MFGVIGNILASATRRSTYVQVIPIYLDGMAAKRYFTERRDEIDAISGAYFQVLITDDVKVSDVKRITVAVDNAHSRVKGLKFGDLPCLWIEDELGRHVVVRLPQTFEDIGQVLRTLADICRETKDAAEIGERLPEEVTVISAERRALGGLIVTKSTEKLIAVACGVVFVAAILVIAIFIGSPTPFQYTIFRIVLALAAAGFVSMTPGFIEAKVGTAVRAGGALAVFVVVFFFAPAALQATT